MRYSGLVLAAAGAALAAEEHTTVLTIGYTNSAGSAVTAVTTYTYEYENPLTSLLTQTNSDGVITGGAATMLITSQPPVVTTQPAVETSQPAVATIPAGLSDGEHTIVIPVGNGTTSFTVSVGHSTTIVLGTEASTTAGKPTGSGSGSGSSNGSPTGSSTSSSASSSATGNAASGYAPASAGLLSLGALLAALF